MLPLSQRLVKLIVPGGPDHPRFNTDNIGDDLFHGWPGFAEGVKRGTLMVAVFQPNTGHAVAFLAQGSFDVPGMPVG